jgi:hypothetical protein
MRHSLPSLNVGERTDMPLICVDCYRCLIHACMCWPFTPHMLCDLVAFFSLTLHSLELGSHRKSYVCGLSTSSNAVARQRTESGNEPRRSTRPETWTGYSSPWWEECTSRGVMHGEGVRDVETAGYRSYVCLNASNSSLE